NNPTGGLQLSSNPHRRTLIYNNTIYNNNGQGMDIGGGATNLVAKNNIFYNNSGGNITNNSGSKVLSNNLTTNPNFINSYIGDFHLQSGSSAKDAGANLAPTVVDDFSGVPRPQGCCYDIGAYEYVGVVSQTASLPAGP